MVGEPGLLVWSGYTVIFQNFLSMSRVCSTIYMIADVYKVLVVMINHHEINGIQGYFRKSRARDGHFAVDASAAPKEAGGEDLMRHLLHPRAINSQSGKKSNDARFAF